MSRRSPHDRRLDKRLNELERNPFREPIRADHTDEYPDPEEVNGHIPDYVSRSVFGGVTIGEIEDRDDNSTHTRDQFKAFGDAAESPMVDFEVSWVDDKNESSGLLDWF